MFPVFGRSTGEALGELTGIETIVVPKSKQTKHCTRVNICVEYDKDVLSSFLVSFHNKTVSSLA